MSSGRHRRPEADPLPDVDIAERLAAGQSGNGARTTAVASSPASPTAPARPAGASPLRCRRRPRRPAVPGRRPAAAAPGPTVIARQSRAEQRSARRRAQRQRIFGSPAGHRRRPGRRRHLVAAARGRVDGTVAEDSPRRSTRRCRAADRGRRHRVGERPRRYHGRGPQRVSRARPVPADRATWRAPATCRSARPPTLRRPVGPRRRPDRPARRPRRRTPGCSTRRRWPSWSTPSAASGASTSTSSPPTPGQRDGRRHGRQPAAQGAGRRAYARYLADGEPEQARLARFDDVLTGLRRQAAGRQGRRDAALTAARGGLQPRRWTPSELAGRLTALRSAATKDALVSDVLPVTELDTGGTDRRTASTPGRPRRMMRSALPRGAAAGRREHRAGAGRERRRDPRAGREGPRPSWSSNGFRFINGGNASPLQRRPERRPGAGRHRQEPWRGAGRSPRRSGCPTVVGDHPWTGARRSRT